MTLIEKVQADLKRAMLQRDELTRDTLRMLKSELGVKEIELGRALAEPDELAVLKRAIKSRQDSIASYEEGGRTDAAETERKEIEVIERYLPAQLSEEETRAAVQEIVAELGISTKRDMGQLMKELMARHAGQVDGKLASRIASEVLT